MFAGSSIKLRQCTHLWNYKRSITSAKSYIHSNPCGPRERAIASEHALTSRFQSTLEVLWHCVAIQVVNIDPISTADIDTFSNRSPGREAQMTRSKKWDTDLDEYYHILQTWSPCSTQSNRT